MIKEPDGDLEESFLKVSKSLKKEIKSIINEMKNLSEDEIVEERYQKFRNMGEFIAIGDVAIGDGVK